MITKWYNYYHATNGESTLAFRTMKEAKLFLQFGYEIVSSVRTLTTHSQRKFFVGSIRI